jgi:site-specific DNA-cytosine methylase
MGTEEDRRTRRAALKASGYRVKARLLDAQWLGVPQMRQRIIFVGVREDLQRDPVHPEPLRYRYSVRDALPHLTACKTVAHGYTREDALNLHSPAPSVTSTVGASYQQHEVQSATLLPSDAASPVTELTGRVGSKFKRKKISLDVPLHTVNAQGGLTPLHCAAERTFGRVVGGFHAVFFEEGKKPFEVQEQCPGQIPHVFIATVEIAVSESEKLLLQRNGFPDQFLACDGSISDVRSGPEPVPQAKQTGMQRQCEDSSLLSPILFI